MTWAQFQTAALSWTTTDAARRGTPAENLRNVALVAGARELQRLIPALQEGHEDTFDVGDVTLNGAASQGAMVAGKIQEAYIVQTTGETPCGDPITCKRRCGSRDWRERELLISGAITGPWITVNPQLDIFLFTPAAGGDLDTELLVVWSGIKDSFQNSDNVTFGTEHCAQAVGYFVKAEMARQIDNNLEAWANFMRDFRDKRTDIYLELRQRARADNLERAESR